MHKIEAINRREFLKGSAKLAGILAVWQIPSIMMTKDAQAKSSDFPNLGDAEHNKTVWVSSGNNRVDDRDLICWEFGSSKYGTTRNNPIVKTGPFAGTKIRIYEKDYRTNYIAITFEDPNNIKQRWVGTVKRSAKCGKFERTKACCQ